MKCVVVDVAHHSVGFRSVCSVLVDVGAEIVYMLCGVDGWRCGGVYGVYCLGYGFVVVVKVPATEES